MKSHLRARAMNSCATRFQQELDNRTAAMHQQVERHMHLVMEQELNSRAARMQQQLSQQITRQMQNAGNHWYSAWDQDRK